jgi:6-phosphogluconolactonase
VRGNLFVFDTLDELAEAGAVKMFTYLDEAVGSFGKANLVLSGGRTPRRVFEFLASDDIVSRVDWRKVHLYWGDERCIPPTRPGSNYRMAQEVLLRRLPLPPGNIHRMPGEKPPTEGAALYEQEIVKTLGLKKNEMPRWSLVMIGLGANGEVASIVPGSRAFHEKKRLVVVEEVPTLQSTCLTLTLPAINSARAVMCLVTGREKARVLREVLEGSLPNLPAHFVSPGSGDLSWFVDREAAQELHL